MKLLLDQNLSRKLVPKLARLFPKSAHVAVSGLATANDDVIWSYARENRFTIVTKDVDYGMLASARGFPPKVILLKTGNATTARIEAILKTHLRDIRRFGKDTKSGFLIINR